MKKNTLPNSDDPAHMPEVFVELEYKRISVRSTREMMFLINHCIERSESSDLSLLSSTTIEWESQEKFAVALSLGMKNLLRLIREALDSSGVVYSEPFLEAEDTRDHLFRIHSL